MEKHNVKKVRTAESNVYKGVDVSYMAEYYYCDNTKEMYADERQIFMNDNAMKNAYKTCVEKTSTNMEGR